MPDIPRRTPRQERARVTVEAILTASAQLLLDEGPARLSTNRIAKRAGVSIGTLYQYFPDKEAIVRELAERQLDRQFALFEVDLQAILGPQADLEHAVRALVLGILQTKRMEPELSRALLLAGAIGDEDWNQRWLQRMREVVRSALHLKREHVRPGDLDTMAYVLCTAFEFVLQDALKHRPHLVRDGRLADELAELAIRYLRGPGAAGV